ncbi:15611_t:CDS:2 [Dentiscutata erythropus]|uniref:15611_t:CDS:1 n=1 Tax=Dentiscutata erythropus TaxID=1348616 RepID=A0A9N9AVF9_9GLOM|nr:15611_t:CDS:2 [Dentiscutata erythropus]
MEIAKTSTKLQTTEIGEITRANASCGYQNQQPFNPNQKQQ